MHQMLPRRLFYFLFSNEGSGNETKNCPQVADLQLVSSFVQNSVTGPEKKLEKAIDIAYTTLMHVQLCSHAGPADYVVSTLHTL